MVPEPGDGRSEALRKSILTYGLPVVGAALWAFARFPDRLRWSGDVARGVFGLLAPFYEDMTHVDGYGEALDQALLKLEGAPDRVLDLGCGTGYLARQVKRLFPGTQVIGVDIAPQMVSIAQAEAAAEDLDVEFEIADVAELPFEDESFDLVATHNAMPFADEMMRVLRPGGKALIAFSFAGPWAALAWPALAQRLRKAGGSRVTGSRAGPGFFGMAAKRAGGTRRKASSDAPSAARPTWQGSPAPQSARSRSRSQPRAADAKRARKPASSAARSKRAERPEPGLAGDKRAERPEPGLAGDKRAERPEPGLAGDKRAERPEPGLAGDKRAERPEPSPAQAETPPPSTLGPAG